jgi:hypothetical protein
VPPAHPVTLSPTSRPAQCRRAVCPTLAQLRGPQQNGLGLLGLSRVGGSGNNAMPRAARCRPHVSLEAPTSRGEMAEWLKAHAWKACIPQGIQGSNPCLSAKTSFQTFPEKSYETPKPQKFRGLGVLPSYDVPWEPATGGVCLGVSVVSNGCISVFGVFARWH